MRGSYSGNTLAFQANAESSILLPRSTIQFGVWRSLVAHLVWDQGVQGSNPCTPTNNL